MTVLAVLQARMSSTRLPGKVLMPLAGAPMIVRQIERVARARRIDRLVVATSTGPEDDVLAETCRREGVAVHRGPLDDVLARFVGALEVFPADQVVRLTADCPLADPEVIDATIALQLDSGCDYASNSPEPGAWAKGLDVEVVTADALRLAAQRATTPEEHEHVTWGVWTRPDLYRLAWLPAPDDQADVRWTVDRPDDYAFVAAVYDALYPRNRAFGSEDIRAFLRERPDLADYGGDRRL
ncbi:cytidylyltransferase domain-containing protein [Caulobacter mirabilis]|uniref:Flagellin modification protein FlmC n=1 Tax=Caulobacter mirabilis TaxID=69666 RepID=A0A2D2AU67_9CAUL|nr:glycosyltransferase family protein [Caulobacter mirabilis]ATQ41558.1 flagellin modification protein FlmC [Caulobacter mirabilis]